MISINEVEVIIKLVQRTKMLQFVLMVVGLLQFILRGGQFQAGIGHACRALRDLVLRLRRAKRSSLRCGLPWRHWMVRDRTIIARESPSACSRIALIDMNAGLVAKLLHLVTLVTLVHLISNRLRFRDQSARRIARNDLSFCAALHQGELFRGHRALASANDRKSGVKDIPEPYHGEFEKVDGTNRWFNDFSRDRFPQWDR